MSEDQTNTASSNSSGVAEQPIVTDVRSGVDMIAEERQRQVEKEGWTPEHDDEHDDGQLVSAAQLYLIDPKKWVRETSRYGWPWDEKWWKPTPDDRVRELTKAGALIAAEIDRLQRKASR